MNKSVEESGLKPPSPASRRGAFSTLSGALLRQLPVCPITQNAFFNWVTVSSLGDLSGDRAEVQHAFPHAGSPWTVQAIWAGCGLGAYIF